MRVGVVIVPDRPWAEARRDWELAESLGCDHAWTFDHLTMGAFPRAPWQAAIPTLAAAALVTSRLAIGTLVATPNLHHPVSLAHDLATLYSLSEGRLIAGLGSGGRGPDAIATRPEPLATGARVARFSEFTEVVAAMFAGLVDSYRGHYYQVGRAELRLLPEAGSIPLLIAATGPKTMRLAAKFGAAWVTNCSEDELEAQTELFDSVAGGRPVNRMLQLSPAWTDRLHSADAFVKLAERAESLGFTDLVVPFRGGTGPLRRWLEQR